MNYMLIIIFLEVFSYGELKQNIKGIELDHVRTLR